MTNKVCEYCKFGLSESKHLFLIIHIKESGKLNFDQFYTIASNFLEEEDDEAMQNELKEAFRLYDKAGMNFTHYYTQLCKQYFLEIRTRLFLCFAKRQMKDTFINYINTGAMLIA